MSKATTALICQEVCSVFVAFQSTNREHIKEMLREEVWKCFHEALGTSRIMEQAVPDASLYLAATVCWKTQELQTQRELASFSHNVC